MLWLTFKEVLDEVASGCGLDPTPLGNLQENLAASLCRYIEKRTRLYWRKAQWPELCPDEERHFRPVWDMTTAYKVGDEVWEKETNAYYMALVDNTGVPVRDSAVWAKLCGVEKSIPFDRQPGRARIGDPLAAWRRDPKTNANPLPLHFDRTTHGMTFRPDAPNTVFIRFRLPAPRFSTSRTDRAEPWHKGDVFYDPESGDCFRVSNSVAADWLPTVMGADVEPQRIPDYLKSAVVEGAIADWLREDGQYDKAATRDQWAEENFQEELSQLSTQQQQTRRYAVRTHR